MPVLRWQNLDLNKGELRVQQAIYRGRWARRRPRAVEVRCRCRRSLSSALKQHLECTLKYGPDDLVFCSRAGTPLNNTDLMLRHLKPAGRSIGAPWLSWHTLRRTHATLLQLAGRSAKDAQAQLGHAQITTTLGIYTLPIPSHQRAAVEKLSVMVTNGDEFVANAESGNREAVCLQ